MKPGLVIADEPTTALDVTTQAEILGLFRQLVRDDGIALMLVTHDLAEAVYFADRVVLLRAGAIVQSGLPNDLYDAPADDFVSAFVSAQGGVR